MDVDFVKLAGRKKYRPAGVQKGLIVDRLLEICV